MGIQTAFKGTPVKVAGPFVQVGTKAPDFKLITKGLGEYTLASVEGKSIVLNIFPSIDTGVCATSVRTFNKLAAGMPNTIVLAISRDLPFAQGRFCGAEGIDNVITLSDYRDFGFAKAYGVLLEDGPLAGLLARCVVVINPSGEIIYTEMVPEITQEPNYEAALSAL